MATDTHMHGFPAKIHDDVDNVFNNKFRYALYFPDHLELLPSELIAIIAQHLPKEYLLTLRSLGNRRISNAINDVFQSNLCFGSIFLNTALDVPALRNLTCLKMQLEMFTFGDNVAMKALAQLLENSANLKSLGLSAGPLSLQTWSQRSENWAPLLQLLGHRPSFRLRTLELDGLATSITSPTLAQIIHVHSSSIRRLTLKHINFYRPNTLREFYTVCALSSIQYYRPEKFLIHGKRMLCSSVVRFDIVETDLEEKNPTCQDWVEVAFQNESDLQV
ncbi:hypothetical protein G6011_04027 [Alternaria panax]|uniref:Uncharacterized protein n=1 Tax=Alternaria panax TaxID=48097 RepID=A0AAD4IFR7_9PLEO|nr:hypothetical protein G6011_04027 [Alternaria panax]